MSSEKCLSRFTISACFVPTDSTESEIPLNKFISIGKDASGDTTRSYLYVLASDPNMTPLTSLTNIGGVDGVIEDRPCSGVDKVRVEDCFTYESVDFPDPSPNLKTVAFQGTAPTIDQGAIESLAEQDATIKDQTQTTLDLEVVHVFGNQSGSNTNDNATNSGVVGTYILDNVGNSTIISQTLEILSNTGFDDGFRIEIGGVTVMSFDFSDWDGNVDIDGIINNGNTTYVWQPWFNEGSPSIEVVEGQEPQLLVTSNNIFTTSDGVSVNTGDRVDIWPYIKTSVDAVSNPVPTIDFVSGVDVGVFNRNENGPWSIGEVTIKGSVELAFELSEKCQKVYHCFEGGVFTQTEVLQDVSGVMTYVPLSDALPNIDGDFGCDCGYKSFTRDFEKSDCQVVDADGNKISGWEVFNYEVTNELGGLVDEGQVAKLNGVITPLPAGATIDCESCDKRTPINYKLTIPTTGDSQIWAVTDAANATISYPTGEVVNVTISNGVGNFGFNPETIFYNEAGNGSVTLEFDTPLDEPVVSYDNMANGNKWGNYRFELWDGTIVTNPPFVIEQLRPPATNPEGFVVFNSASTADDLIVTTGSVSGVDYVTDDMPTNSDATGQAGGIVRFTGSYASQGGIRKVIMDHESVSTFFTGFIQFAGKLFNFNPCLIGFHDECGKIYDSSDNEIDPTTITLNCCCDDNNDDTSTPDYTAQFDAMISSLSLMEEDTTLIQTQLSEISGKVDNLDDNADTQELLDIIAELQEANTALTDIDGNTDGIEAQLASIISTLQSELDQSQVIQQGILNKLNEPCAGSPQNVKVCVDSVERSSGGIIATTAGTSPAGKVAISFHNNSDTITMVVDGLPLGAGETVPFGVDAPDTNAPKVYDPNGGEMIIRWIDA